MRGSSAEPLDLQGNLEAKDKPAWVYSETETVESLHFYNQVSRMGLCYGPKFRMVQKLNTADNTEAQLR